MKPHIHVGRGVIYLTSAELFFFLTSYITYFFIGRALRPEEFGIFGVVVFLASMINTVITTAFQQTISRFVAQDTRYASDVRTKGLLVVLCFSFAITLLYLASAGWIASLLNDASLAVFIRISSALILVSSVFHGYLGYLNGLKRFREHAIITYIYSLLRLLLIVSAVWLGYGVKGALVAIILSPLAFVLVFMFRYSGGRISGSVTLRRIFAFAYPLMLFTIVLNLFLNLDLFMVKSLSDESSANLLAGLYTAASTLARIPYYLILGLSMVLFPLISESTHANNHERTRKQISRSMRYCLLFLVPIVAVISSTSRGLLTLVYSAAYAGAAPALGILIIGNAFFALFVILTTVVSGSGQPKKSFLISVPLLVLDLILNYLLITRWGISGAAAGTTIASAAAFFIAAYYVHRKFKALISAASTIRIIASGAAVYAVSLAVGMQHVLLPLKFLLLGSLYLIVLFISGEVRKDDIRFFRSLVP
ncbi:MAG: oligosaccharide flippase family protein [archaeon]